MDEFFMEAWDLVEQNVHKVAKDKGWWNAERNNGELIALIHSEISEALEAMRIPDAESEKISPFTKVEEELADTVIRIMDMAAARGWNISAAILEKIKYNENRTYRHGGKIF